MLQEAPPIQCRILHEDLHTQNCNLRQKLHSINDTSRHGREYWTLGPLTAAERWMQKQNRQHYSYLLTKLEKGSLLQRIVFVSKASSDETKPRKQHSHLDLTSASKPCKLPKKHSRPTVHTSILGAEKMPVVVGHEPGGRCTMRS